MGEIEIALYDDAGLAALRNRLWVRHACPECGATDHGRPLIDEGYLSIAHAGDRHVVARSPRPVGIDAEPDAAGAGIESVTLHRAERAVLAGLAGDERRRAVLEVWVAKEAALKLTGAGLRTAPESFVVRHADGWRVDTGVLDPRPVAITPVTLAGYVVMLASRDPGPRIGAPRLAP